MRDTQRTGGARRPVLAVGAVVAVTLLGMALWLFQPWALLVDRTVDEAVPVGAVLPSQVRSPAAEPAAPTTVPAPGPATASQATAPATAPEEPVAAQPAVEPVELSRGAFVSHEHPTEGLARVLELADGSRVLRIEGLDTSNGPDLRVWLTDAPVLPGRDGWFVFDDGAYVELGALKGNKGDQNYELPADVDLDTLTSVSVWCARFSVSFGAAQLTG